MRVTLLIASSFPATLQPVTAYAGMTPLRVTAQVSANVQNVGLSWRCGKKNPVMWGTFGNGCLKQKRAYKRKSEGKSGSRIQTRKSKLKPQ
ncbi:MAG: hypothetical protein ACR2PG_17915 [Hyphomicrobiaceae bacterium]